MGSTCVSQYFYNYSSTMALYTFSNETGDTSGAGTRVTTNAVDKKFINQIRNAIDAPNSNTAPAYWQNYNQAF